MGNSRTRINTIHRFTYGTKYSRMDKIKFVDGNLQKILLAPFLNIFAHIFALDREICKQIPTNLRSAFFLANDIFIYKKHD